MSHETIDSYFERVRNGIPFTGQYRNHKPKPCVKLRQRSQARTLARVAQKRLATTAWR